MGLDGAPLNSGGVYLNPTAVYHNSDFGSLKSVGLQIATLNVPPVR